MTAVTPAVTPDLLADYRPGAALFCSPRGSLLADGVLRHVQRGPGGWAAAARAALAETGGELVVGALGFDPVSTGRLVVPERVLRAGPLRPGEPAGAGSPPRLEVRSRDDGSAYRAAVREALRRLADGPLEKVVLARAVELAAPEAVPVPVLLGNLVHALARRDPRAHVFAVPTGPGTLVGASPELLVARRGRTVVAHPLAGSAPRDPDPVTDRARASALARSAKDLREHRAVATAVAGVLRPYCPDLHLPGEPFLVRTATMWHLSTRITGTLADPGVTALELAEALHPTPAVAGTPGPLAMATIDEIEHLDRGFYAGLVGWCDTRGDGEWAVTIRCAEIDDTTLRLCAGAGIVAGSDPAAELAETSAKLATLLGALGVEARL